MTPNRKIINATPVEADGIKFKSKMELLVYKTLVDKGYHPTYEPLTFDIIPGFKPTIQFYVDGKPQTSKVRAITYTPDFMFNHNNFLVFVEVKGWENDTYSLKKKLFRKYLESWDKPVIFFEVHTKKGLLACLKHLNSL